MTKEELQTVLEFTLQIGKRIQALEENRTRLEKEIMDSAMEKFSDAFRGDLKHHEPGN